MHKLTLGLLEGIEDFLQLQMLDIRTWSSKLTVTTHNPVRLILQTREQWQLWM